MCFSILIEISLKKLSQKLSNTSLKYKRKYLHFLVSENTNLTEKDMYTNQEIMNHSGLFPQSRVCNNDLSRLFAVVTFLSHSYTS